MTDLSFHAKLGPHDRAELRKLVDEMAKEWDGIKDSLLTPFDRCFTKVDFAEAGTDAEVDHCLVAVLIPALTLRKFLDKLDQARGFLADVNEALRAQAEDPEL